jgi:hypothetical protein
MFLPLPKQKGWIHTEATPPAGFHDANISTPPPLCAPDEGYTMEI